MRAQASDTRSFRLLPRYVGVAVTVALAALTAYMVVAIPRWDTLVFAAVFMAPWIWLNYRLASVVVVADPHGLRVRNVFSTREIRWAEIRNAEFRSYGPCYLLLLDGRSIGLFALQQSNWRNMTGRQSPALLSDLQYLNDRAADARAAAGIPDSYPSLSATGRHR